MSETQNIEYKSVWRDDYLKWLCGFANANGGVLYIGKSDNGEIVGVKDTKKLLEELPNKIRTTMGMVADVSLETENQKDCIIVEIQPYPSPISYHGKYYLRSGATNQELTGNALDEFMLRKQGKTWDSVPVPFVKIEDLDKEAFSLFRKKAIESKRLSDEDLAMDDQALLKNLMLTENEYLKRSAIREAVLNAIVHKDYSSGVPVQIRIYEDKIQISNTGRLPAELTAETMLQSNTSRPHNPLIANTFFRCGFIESWGRGIDKMNKACIADGLQSPVYQTISDSVVLKFEGHKPEEFIDKKTGRVKYWNSNEEKEFKINDPVIIANERVNTENDLVKDVFDPVNSENDLVKDVFDPVIIANERVKEDLIQIYSFIEQNPLVKTASIEKFINKSNKTIKRYLKILKDNNLIEYVGSDKIGGYKIAVN